MTEKEGNRTYEQMLKKEELEIRLYERMSMENEKYLNELKTKSADDIIRSAYEIACRDNLFMIFEDVTDLNAEQLEVLLEFENPLAELYDDWINRDTDEMDNFRYSIRAFTNDILDRRAKEKHNNSKPKEVAQKKRREMER